SIKLFLRTKLNTPRATWAMISCVVIFFFFSSRRRHTRCLSDWSSDVCSSDLAESLMTDLAAAEARGVLAALLVEERTELDVRVKIGRASCRERVYSSVVGVSLKKKKARKICTLCCYTI